MSGLLEFVAYFLLASGVTVAAQALVRDAPPARLFAEGMRFFLYVVGGVAIFSVLVWCLEQVFIHRFWA